MFIRWIIFRFFVHLLFDIAVADDKTQINLRFLSFAIRKIGIELAGIISQTIFDEKIDFSFRFQKIIQCTLFSRTF